MPEPEDRAKLLNRAVLLERCVELANRIEEDSAKLLSEIDTAEFRLRAADLVDGVHLKMLGDAFRGVQDVRLFIQAAGHGIKIVAVGDDRLLTEQAR